MIKMDVAINREIVAIGLSNNNSFSLSLYRSLACKTDREREIESVVDG